MAIAYSASDAKARPMSSSEKKVIFASSLGTVFEWYDFYLYGTLTPVIATQFFSVKDAAGNFLFDESTRNIFALLAFAAGFIVRPFGALVFGRVGDLVGRKYTFLVTIMIMGLSTFIVGLLPNSQSIGIWAPIILITLRLLQGLALGGEYGGAATYVAEHAPQGRRGFYTSWIQTTATLGLFISLLVILFTRTFSGEADFAAFYWRVPFLVSLVLLGISIWIRLQLSESPAFQKMKSEGTGSKAPLTEAFGQWRNAKVALIALLGLVMGQGVVWYTGQFYALFFMQSILKVDGYTANLLIAWSLLLGTGFFVFFGWLSDKIGRKPIILLGCAIAVGSYFTIFARLAEVANPSLANAIKTVKIEVTANPADCGSLFNPVGTAKFTTSCDLGRQYLSSQSFKYTTTFDPAATVTKVKIGDKEVLYDTKAISGSAKTIADAQAASDKAAAAAKAAPTDEALKTAAAEALAALNAAKATNPQNAILAAAYAAGYPKAGDASIVKMSNPFDIFRPQVSVIIGYLFVLVLLVTMVYGPIAAALVELFPTRIRYTSMSLPYHIGNGWFGGLLPASAAAMVAQTGDIYYGLWYPIIFAAITVVIGLFFVPETKDRDIYTYQS